MPHLDAAARRLDPAVAIKWIEGIIARGEVGDRRVQFGYALPE